MAYPPTATLAVAAVPTIPTWASFHSPTSGGPITSHSWSTGDTIDESTLDEIGTRGDLGDRYGGGGYGVIPGPAGTGCNLSAGAGLSLNIAAGHVMMDGTVPIAAQAVVLTDNIARVYVWASQAGAIVQVNNSLTPPAGAHVFLGSAVTAAGAISSIDFSGVVYLTGSFSRFTTDATVPLDTPPSTISFWHHGAADTWLWTGSEYLHVSSGSGGILPVADGGTGGDDAAEARANLSTQARGLLTISVTGDMAPTAADLMNASQIHMTDGGVSTDFTLTLPNTGLVNGAIWGIKNSTGEGCEIVVASGSESVYMQDAHEATLVYWTAEIHEIGRRNPRYLSSLDQVVTEPHTYTQWRQIEADYVALIPSGGFVNVNWPTSGALDNKGRIQVIQNEHATLGLNVRTNGAGGDDATNTLLPGELSIMMVELNGSLVRVPTRPQTPRRSVEMSADANFTVVSDSFLAWLLEITSAVALTATRELILPLVDAKIYHVANLTSGGQSITVKASSGTGVTIANGSVAMVVCNGTNYRRLSADVAY